MRKYKISSSLNEIEMMYGRGYKTEKDIVIGCIEKINTIEMVLDIKGLDFIHTYLSHRLSEITNKR